MYYNRKHRSSDELMGEQKLTPDEMADSYFLQIIKFVMVDFADNKAWDFITNIELSGEQYKTIEEASGGMRFFADRLYKVLSAAIIDLSLFNNQPVLPNTRVTVITDLNFETSGNAILSVGLRREPDDE